MSKDPASVWREEIRRRLAGARIDPARKDEIVEELSQHLEDRYRELLTGGATESAAHRRCLAELSEERLLAMELRRGDHFTAPASIVLGGPKKDMTGDLIQDARYGLRLLRRSPGFTAVAALSLALGIGANTAIFTLLNAVIVKPLPVRDPQALVLFNDAPGEGTSNGDPYRGKWPRFSFSIYEYIRDNSPGIEELSAFRSGESALSVQIGSGADHSAQQARGHLVSGNYFSVLGVEAARGRVLRPDDDKPNALPAAVISDRFFRERCNSDDSIVGQTVLVNGFSFTIVGVMPPGFFGVRVRSAPDFWLPLVFQPQIELRDSFLTANDVFWLNAVGRLQKGTTIEQANASVNLALRQILTSQAGTPIAEEGQARIDSSFIDLRPGAGGISGLRYFYAEPLKMLMAIVAVVLLIACANIGNLLLSRSLARQMEIFLRLSLGASRSRLIRQLLTESLLLAILGGALGLLLAQAGVKVLVNLVASTAPLDVAPDLLVFGFTAGVSLLSGLFFGFIPAIRAGRADLATGMKERSVRVSGGRVRLGLTPALVVSQVALSLVLLVGAVLFGRSLLKLQNEDVGFDRDNLLLVDINSRLAGYKPKELSGLYRQLLERVNAVPGVEAATLATYSPMSGSSRVSTVTVQGYTPQSVEEMDVLDMLVGPDYCRALGVPLLQGREIALKDSPGSPAVAMVNRAFADYFFAGENPIGRRFGYGDDPRNNGDLEIVGVIGDVRYTSTRKKPEPAIFVPILQVQEQGAFACDLEIRTAGEPLGVVTAIRAAIGGVDPKLPATTVTTMSKQLDDSLRLEKLVARLVSFFGLLALVLACLGLYGVMAHAVARRTNEIGVRMALGANQNRILRMVLRETLTLVLVGIAIGIPTALAAERAISSQLYQFEPGDPWTLAAAALVLTCVAALAGYLPARRASRVDPMVALRYE